MDRFEAMHGLAIRKPGTSAAVALVLGVSEVEVQSALEAVVADGLAMSAKGAFELTPKGREALAADYPARFAALRADPGLAEAYARFEVMSNGLKQLITEWQTMVVVGETVPNDHSDADYDTRIIDRLGNLHERAEAMLASLAAPVPRLQRYTERLDHALDRAEAGETAFVSGAKIDSYHTVWFELHEDLLRILDRKRGD